MAGSRLDKIGTIFSRATGLLRSGAIKYQDRPVWYDVYRVFPPKYEPYIEREPERTSEIPDILYKEDTARAEFFKRYGSNPGGEVRHLNDLRSEEASQTFIKRYQEVEKRNPDFTPDQVFEAAAEGLQLARVESGRGSGRRMRQPQQLRTEYGYDERIGRDDTENNLADQQQHVSSSGKRKTPIISAESLRSLFEEAKDKQSHEEASKSGGSRTETVKDGDKS